MISILKVWSITVFLFCHSALFSQEFSLSDTCVKTGSSLELREIRFEFNKANLLDIKQPQLDSLLNFLKKNPTAIVEIGIHTNLRGSAPTNLELSRRRAEYLTRFFQMNGIDSLRCEVVGFGETLPVVQGTELQEIIVRARCSGKQNVNQRITMIIKGYL